MEPERWQRLKDLFYKVLEQDPEERTKAVDEACAGDPSLRREIESLLASHQDADDFLEPSIPRPSPGLLQVDADVRMPGLRLGPYAVQKKIGEGGMGVVYLAEDTRLGRLVALKIVAPQHVSNPEFRERLRREARAAATLIHPAIATVFALEEYGDELFIVSEYVRGATLLEEAAGGPLAEPVLIHTFVEMARALAAAHEHGIVHRDLKPENVIRTPEGAIKILDFGLARVQAQPRAPGQKEARLTREGAFLGTPAYASPEQLLGLPADFRSDIFSFGVMLYELATGVHPFESPDSITTIARILEAEPARPSQIRPALPRALDLVVSRCLQKSPQARYGSARELLSDLEKLRTEAREAKGILPADRGARRDAAKGFPPIFWWRFHQGVIALVYYAMLIPMWKVKQWTGGGRGSLLFYACVAAVAVASNLRFHLWFTSHFYASELGWQRRRVAPWIRCADILFVSLLATGAAVTYGASTPVATLLVAVAAGCLCAFLLIEPTTTRAALPSPAKDGG